ncbi:tudor domain-containing protein 3-like [Vespa mandarinia]|uniref:tudor domain-containing protein 3-like n=1 Tax=Vespa mandarinia TaxID=7446 RepID=UPI00161082EF|nr:tudor domain-containing protein 3-like [Vespa mandarinia]XP_035722922.1 tudor domain-containing protein 3-like [Vespa mandarinia]
MEKLKDHGWYLSNHGFNLVSDSGNINDLEKILRRCLDLDLKEIGSGQGDIHQGNIVLQIQKLRNVAAPKSNEESRGAPRMLKLSLTDGKNNYQAVEIESLSSISLNTPPGTKLLLKSGSIPMSHGIILLKPSHISQLLGGRVSSLVEKWELNKKLAHHSRVRSAEEGGPPPWIPFGKKIIKISDRDKNFKAIAEKDKSSKENAEFEAQRKDAIAEAAKQGSKKVFGGGNKQLLDHSVQRIVEQGFSIEQAEYALRVNRNNVDKAIKSLQRTNNKHKESREPREPRSKRFDKKSEESKPSSGKISLFDFLEDKLPIQPEPIETTQNNYVQNNENNVERLESKADTHNARGGRSQRGGRGYQAPPRHSEENKANKRLNNNNNSGTSQYSQYNGNSNTQQSKPPRFQRNQDTHGYYHQDNGNRTGPQKNQHNEYKNSLPQSHSGIGYTDDSGGCHKNQHEQQGKNSSNNRNYNHYESETRNRHLADNSYNRHNRVQETGTRIYGANTPDRNYRNQLNKYQLNDNASNRENVGSTAHKNENHNLNNQSTNVPVSTPWVWQIGDKCMAKYWEDNRYYNAEVTAVSERTCVVQFKGFENYEEVLQVDCIPITEDIHMEKNDRGRDQRANNRQTRNEQSQNNIAAGMEFRRSGNGPSSGNKGYSKKRGPVRSTQPIYQPPAQRNHYSMPTNIQNNSLL